MLKNVLIKLDRNTYVNLYEIAVVVDDGTGCNVQMKSGGTYYLRNTSAEDVFERIDNRIRTLNKGSTKTTSNCYDYC